LHDINNIFTEATEKLGKKVMFYQMSIRAFELGGCLLIGVGVSVVGGPFVGVIIVLPLYLILDYLVMNKTMLAGFKDIIRHVENIDQIRKMMKNKEKEVEVVQIKNENKIVDLLTEQKFISPQEIEKFKETSLKLLSDIDISKLIQSKTALTNRALGVFL